MMGCNSCSSGKPIITSRLPQNKTKEPLKIRPIKNTTKFVLDNNSKGVDAHRA